MVSCCVPLCENQKGKMKNVSFHEIPCDKQLRAKWLKAISRQGEYGGHWQPMDHSVVCSDHFSTESYREDCKRRVLKVGSIPSVFHNHPEYLKDSMEAKNNIVVRCSNDKIDTKIKIKEEDLVPFIGSKNEANIFTSSDMNSMNDYAIDTKREIKEEATFSHINLKNERDVFSDNVIKIRNNSCEETEDYEMDNKLEIKEGLGCMERILTEPAIPAFHMESEKKDGIYKEDLQSTKTPRLCREEDIFGNDTLEGNVCSSKSERHQGCKQLGNILCDSNLSYKESHLNNGCKISYVHEIHEDFTANPALKKSSLIHKKTLKCGVCEKVFTCRGHLNAHAIIHEGRKSHKCNFCEKRFTRVSSLRRHKFIHKKSNNSEEICTKEDHLRTNKKLHQCNICEKRFICVSNLRRHSLFHKELSNSDICEEICTEEDHLRTNHVIPENKKLHKCNICFKSFTRSASVKRHNLVHEGKRPYKCDICEKSFADKSTLSKHNLIHEGKKQHECNFCGKTFIRRSSMYRHILIHEGKKPHKCNICEKSFHQKSGLNRHKITHEDKGTYTCDVDTQ